MKYSYLFYEPLSDLDEVTRRMQRIAELGYDGIELTATHPLGYDVKELKTAAQRVGIPVVSFLSGWSYGNEGLCLASPNEDVRHRAVDRLSGYVQLAAEVGALLVIGLMQGLRSDESDETKANDRIAAALGKVAQAAEKVNGRIVIEPVNHLQVGFNHTADEVAALTQRVGSPAMTLMLDTIHMNIEERSAVETIRKYGPRVGHFHLCESNGGPFGSGNLDFKAVLGALNEVAYDRFVSVKIYRGVKWNEGAESAIRFLKGA